MISNLPKGQASNPHFRSQEYVLSCTLLRRVKHTRSIIDVPCIPDETWSNRKTTASASLIVRIIAEKREWRMEKRCGRYSWLALVRILKEYIFPLKKIFFFFFSTWKKDEVNWLHRRLFHWLSPSEMRVYNMLSNASLHRHHANWIVDCLYHVNYLTVSTLNVSSEMW